MLVSEGTGKEELFCLACSDAATQNAPPETLTRVRLLHNGEMEVVLEAIEFHLCGGCQRCGAAPPTPSIALPSSAQDTPARRQEQCIGWALLVLYERRHKSASG